MRFNFFIQLYGVFLCIDIFSGVFLIIILSAVDTRLNLGALA